MVEILHAGCSSTIKHARTEQMLCSGSQRSPSGLTLCNDTFAAEKWRSEVCGAVGVCVWGKGFVRPWRFLTLKHLVTQ